MMQKSSELCKQKFNIANKYNKPFELMTFKKEETLERQMQEEEKSIWKKID